MIAPAVCLIFSFPAWLTHTYISKKQLMAFAQEGRANKMTELLGQGVDLEYKDEVCDMTYHVSQRVGFVVEDGRLSAALDLIIFIIYYHAKLSVERLLSGLFLIWHFILKHVEMYVCTMTLFRDLFILLNQRSACDENHCRVFVFV